MRIKLTLAIVVGFLFCTLLAMEFPELVNLVDDTSNDFCLIVFVKNAVAVVKTQMKNAVTAVKTEMLHQRRLALADVRRRQAAASFPAYSLMQTFQTSDDTLHLLCIQRT